MGPSVDDLIDEVEVEVKGLFSVEVVLDETPVGAGPGGVQGWVAFLDGQLIELELFGGVFTLKLHL